MWEAWNEWTACSRSCGGGLRQRLRDCSEVERCLGPYSQEQTCNEQAWKLILSTKSVIDRNVHCRTALDGQSGAHGVSAQPLVAVGCRAGVAFVILPLDYVLALS